MTHIAVGCTCTTKSHDAVDTLLGSHTQIATLNELEINGQLFDEALSTLTAAPHPFGSSRQKVIANYLVAKANSLNPSGDTFRQEFSSKTPNPAASSNPSGPLALTNTRIGWNVIHRVNIAKEPTCAVVIGSHYDTKIVDGLDYVGANDSGSSSVLLLALIEWFQSLANSTDLAKQSCDIVLVWFDGEEAILPDWYDGELSHPARIQDNTYGSRHFVSQLNNCNENQYCLSESLGGLVIRSVIIADMIGNRNLKFTEDRLSHPQLRSWFKKAADQLGFGDRMARLSREIEDDHIPFVRAGIPALLVIDFENMATWHTHGDTPERVSAQSLAITGRIISHLAISLAQPSKVSLQ